jgi:hypothetical protein
MLLIECAKVAVDYSRDVSAVDELSDLERAFIHSPTVIEAFWLLAGRDASPQN